MIMLGLLRCFLLERFGHRMRIERTGESVSERDSRITVRTYCQSGRCMEIKLTES